MEIVYDKLEEIYNNEIRKNTKNKKKVYRFDLYKVENLIECYNTLLDSSNYNFKYNIFLIRRPKYRIVMALDLKDKLINHYITRYMLMPKFEKYLDFRNVATRKDMGRDYGIKLVLKYIEYYKHKDNCYCLKLDIKKYFYSIDHKILKDMLRKNLTDEEYKLMDIIINSTNCEYINDNIKRLKNKELSYNNKRTKEIEEVPLYEEGKGLPIGNMTSQFLAIFYLNGLDHKIIHDFKIKHYVRYMDDFLLFSDDKEYLKELKFKIENILNTVYCLKLNSKKTKITSIKEGFCFCGYHFRVKNNKTIITIPISTRNRVKGRIKEVKYLYQNGKISLNSCFCSVETYLNGFVFGDSRRIKRMVEKYFLG